MFDSIRNMSNSIRNSEDERSPLGFVKYFLLWAAGADLSTLRKAESDHAKYTAIGMMMAAIPCVATVSAFSFLKLSFGIPTILAVLGGAGWGLLIFILDRLILTYHRKDKHELLRAIPRLVLALSLAFVIGEPLLLRLFKGEIDLELSRSGQTLLIDAHDKANARFSTEKTGLVDANADLQKRLDELKRIRDEKEAAVIGEIEGTVGTGIKGEGLAARQKQEAFSEAKAEYERARDELLPKMTANKQRLDQIDTSIENEVKAISESGSAAGGVMARHGALWRIIKRDPSAAMTYIPLFLVILLLEISPLVMKLTTAGAEYEKRLTLKERNAITGAEREAALDRENHKRRIHLRREVARQITQAAESGDHQGLQQEEQEVAKQLRASVLDEFHRDFKTPKTSGNGSKAFGSEISIDITNHPEIQVRLQLPAGVRATTTLEQLDGDIQRIADELGNGTGDSFQLVVAEDSGGNRLLSDLPLLPQLKTDQKLRLTFAPVDASNSELPIA